MAVINSGGDDKTAHPKNAGGAAQAGDAPVFVKNLKEYSRHVFFVHAPACGRWMVYAFNVGAFALLYALACVLAGQFFPQLYQSWLDWLAPLTEYVGGLTPRADRITGELIANGYPERADDAVHGIAMARIFLVPVVMCMLSMLMVAFNAAKASPLNISCTRKSLREPFLLVCISVPFLVLAICYEEFISGEDFGNVSGVRRYVFLHRYHKGDFAVIMEIGTTLASFGALVMMMALILMIRATRFNIVEQHEDGDKKS